MNTLHTLAVAGSLLGSTVVGWTGNEYWSAHSRAELVVKDADAVEGFANDFADQLSRHEREFARVQKAVCSDYFARSQIIRVQAEQPSSPILCAGKP